MRSESVLFGFLYQIFDILKWHLKKTTISDVANAFETFTESLAKK